MSYDHSEDLNYRNMLLAWDKNPRFEFAFDDRAPHTPIESEGGGPIKAALTKKLRSDQSAMPLER